MILVVVGESIVKVHISLKVLGQVELNLAAAWLQLGVLDVLRTCYVLVFLHAVRVIYYMLLYLQYQGA